MVRADEDRSRDADRGREATTPSQIPVAGWKDIAWRVAHEIVEDRVLLIAAGVTFYLILALFPALAAFISLYGLFADPADIAGHLSYLAALLPSAGLDIIRQQLQSLASQDSGSLRIGVIIGLAVALWSANGGVKALFEAMNVAYEEREKRSFLRLNLVSMTFTLATILAAIVLILAAGILPTVLAFLRVDRWAELLFAILRWPVLLLIALAGIAALYRFGPSRTRAKWRWLSWGAVLAVLVWTAASLAFSFYLRNFADYNATYGTLGAAIGLMMWIWISTAILIVGAEINAEMEHQTAHDSTVGEPKPRGERGAVVADTLGRTSEEAS